MSQSGVEPFWRRKRLGEMTQSEWESLCDGCGRCCLHKLRDEETNELAFTDVSCHQLDRTTGRCLDYKNRLHKVPDCTALTPELVDAIDWLPPSCAYRLVAEGRDLPDWHPLRTGDPDSTRRAGASVAGRVRTERTVENLEDHIVEWPVLWPRAGDRDE
ncbi:MAG TPA: YcgN family cysteine cluster protein [Acidiphilium sp.]|jgi:uncharacterized cysteine cluster protein YcgN (CxxCxxCC family)|uniref:YcgN family cysteine cluster protein n=1 Tax=unclassified Acidiphilium TaxID=2617493 RepID=UPI000BD4BEEF|nr:MULTISPECIES: YcgN family cysteine cluster protein [unclassified Acidiphilium]OYV55514.1 MAG: hypothetical protein B7Z76_10170 [Acidiphilium sp. 20-67-58]HQT61725.1 YcgN family cysteine cluster protein [Acidiphilium sp.]HQU11151.1 YcgN family cysteine cluster protein [Acidiphilium sp.]